MMGWMVNGLVAIAVVLGAPGEGAAPEPTLQEQLEARQSEFAQSAPAEMIALFEQGVEDVGASGVLEGALKVGDHAPSFTLPNELGEPVPSSDLLAKGPVVLTFYRGGWCPYCNIQLQAMQRLLPQFEAAGAHLVAISPDKPDLSLDTVQKEELSFTVLSDMGNQVAREFGVLYALPDYLIEVFRNRMDLPARTGGTIWELPLAATYVIDMEGVIRYAFLDEDYRKRAEPAELLAAVQTLSP